MKYIVVIYEKTLRFLSEQPMMSQMTCQYSEYMNGNAFTLIMHIGDKFVIL